MGTQVSTQDTPAGRTQQSVEILGPRNRQRWPRGGKPAPGFPCLLNRRIEATEMVKSHGASNPVCRLQDFQSSRILAALAERGGRQGCRGELRGDFLMRYSCAARSIVFVVLVLQCIAFSATPSSSSAAPQNTPSEQAPSSDSTPPQADSGTKGRAEARTVR